MHEHSLNGIVHVLAALAIQAGDRREEAAVRAAEYLSAALGLRETDPSFGLLRDLLDVYADTNDPVVAERGAASVCAKLEPVLSPEEKQSFLLHALHACRGWPDPAGQSDAMLERSAELLRIPAEEWSEWRHFVVAGLDEPDTKYCRRFRRMGWKAEALVFHGKWTSRYYIRALRGEMTLDENPVERERFYALETGAILRDAGGQAVYLCEIQKAFSGGDETSPIRFEAENLQMLYGGGGAGIRNFSFRETGGRLVGVMGGSGVGKSTLIDVLNGSLKPQSGRVLLNGIDLYGGTKAPAGAIGFVPQDDLLFEELTVRENLDYNARLCLPGLGQSERRDRVNRMLRELHQDETADLKVGSPLDKKISGGQRKRLNVALELIREPAVLFVDEPTSGLSSADSDVVMGLLKEQAAKGRLVIAIVHQPSSNLFRQFDALWILDRGGFPIYTGHPLEALKHLRETAHLAGADRGACPECGNVSPEQIFAVVEAKAIDSDGRFSRDRKHSPQFWHEAWIKTLSNRSGSAHSEDNGSGEAYRPPEREQPRWLRQFRVFAARTCKSRMANRAYVALNAFEPPILSFLTAWLCRAAPNGTYALGDNPYLHVYFFMAVIVAIFLGLSVSAEEIVRDQRVLKRERFLRLSWSAYSAAKLAHVGFLSLLQAGTCAAVGVWVLEIPELFAKLWAILFSAGAFGAFLGLNVSARSRNAVTVYVLLPLLLLPQMLLGGLIVAYDDLRSNAAPNAYPPVICELAASRWAFEALATEQFSANAYQRHFMDIDAELSRLDYCANEWIPAIAGRIDASFLDAVSAHRRIELLRLAANELRELEREGGPPGLSDDAARLEPPARDGLDGLKTALREYARRLQEDRLAAQRRRNEVHRLLLETRGEKELAAMVKRHTNRRIADLVRNRLQLAAIRERGGKLVRESDPIFQVPRSSWGRAPFMAGQKKIGTFILKTFSFNLAVLWAMNGILAAWLATCRRK